MSEQRYEVAAYIGPCSEAEAEALCDAILDLPEARAVGMGGVGLSVFTEESGPAPDEGDLPHDPPLNEDCC